MFQLDVGDAHHWMVWRGARANRWAVGVDAAIRKHGGVQIGLRAQVMDGGTADGHLLVNFIAVSLIVTIHVIELDKEWLGQRDWILSRIDEGESHIDRAAQGYGDLAKEAGSSILFHIVVQEVHTRVLDSQVEAHAVFLTNVVELDIWWIVRCDPRAVATKVVGDHGDRRRI